MGLMMEVRLMMTRRSAPATSAPRPKASRTTAKKAKRNRATAKEPMVRRRRTFLRKRLARMSLLNFMPYLPRQHSANRRLRRGHLFPGAELYRRAEPRRDRE